MAGRGAGGGLLLLAARAERRARAHQQIERVVDRLQPRAHFFIERSRQEPELLAHGHDRAADGDAGVAAVEHLMQAGGHGDERLAGAGVAVAGDQRDFRIEQRVDQAALAEVERLERLAVRDLQHLREIEAHEAPVRREARGNRLFLTGAEQNVFVDGDALDPVFRRSRFRRRWRSAGVRWHPPRCGAPRSSTPRGRPPCR